MDFFTRNFNFFQNAAAFEKIHENSLCASPSEIRERKSVAETCFTLRSAFRFACFKCLRSVDKFMEKEEKIEETAAERIETDEVTPEVYCIGPCTIDQ